MVIWYFNHYSGSVINPRIGRSYYLAKALTNAGHSATVIAASYHHLLKVDEISQCQESAVKKKVDDVNFLWFKVPKYRGNGIGRILNMFCFAIQTWRTNLITTHQFEKPDAIIISSVHPFHIFSGIKWARKFNAKLIFEVRDIWPLSLNILLGLSKKHPFSKLLGFIEKVAYQNADLIVSPLINVQEHINTVVKVNKDFLYLPNGFNPDFSWAESSVIDEQLKALRQKYDKIIMHTGSMGLPNGLEILINAANQLKNDASTAFVLIGNGGLKNDLKEQACSSHIYFFEPIAKTQVQAALSYADAGYCGAQDHPELYKFGVSPNKVFDYFLASKPVILAINSPNNPVEQSGAGFCFKPDKTESLLSIILRLKEQDKLELSRLGEQGKRFLEKEHNFNAIAKRLVDKIKIL